MKNPKNASRDWWRNIAGGPVSWFVRVNAFHTWKPASEQGNELRNGFFAVALFYLKFCWPTKSFWDFVVANPDCFCRFMLPRRYISLYYIIYRLHPSLLCHILLYYICVYSRVLQWYWCNCDQHNRAWGYILCQFTCEVFGHWRQTACASGTLAHHRHPWDAEFPFQWGKHRGPPEASEEILGTLKGLQWALGARGNICRDGHHGSHWILWGLSTSWHALWLRTHPGFLCQRGTLEAQVCALVAFLGLGHRGRTINQWDDSSNLTASGLVTQPCILWVLSKGRPLGPASWGWCLTKGRTATDSRESSIPMRWVEGWLVLP